MDTPGIVVRPIETMHGSPEFSEVFFDDVVVPVERTLGDEGQGWSVAMDLLPYERSTALWHRAAYLHTRLQDLLEAVPPDALDPVTVGEVTQLLYALRARSRATQYRLAAGDRLGAGDVHRQGAGGHGRAGGVRSGGRRAGPGAGRRRRCRQSAGGGASSSTRGPPPSTVAPPRSSGTSSPAGCSIWGPTVDGGHRPPAVRAQPPPRRASPTPARTSMPPSAESGGTRRWPRTRRPAVSVLFELLGAANAESSALAAVLGRGLGLPSPGPGGLLLPMPGPGTPPGTLEGGSLTVGGLSTAPPVDAGPMLVVTGADDAVVGGRGVAGRPRPPARRGDGPLPRPGRGDRHRRALHRRARPGAGATGPGRWTWPAWPSATSWSGRPRGC